MKKHRKHSRALIGTMKPCIQYLLEIYFSSLGGMFFYHFFQSSVMIKDFTNFCQNLVTFHSFSVFKGVFRPQIYVISHLKWLKYWSLKVVGKLRPNKKNLEFLIRDHPIEWDGEKAILRYFFLKSYFACHLSLELGKTPWKSFCKLNNL